MRRSATIRSLLVPGDVPILAFALVLPVTVAWLRFYHLSEAQTVALWTGVALKVVQYGLPLAWVVLVRRERFSPAFSGKGTGEGLGSGLFVLALAVGVYHGWLKPGGSLSTSADALVRNKFIQLGMQDPSGYVAFAGFYSLAHTFLEEYYWRWFVFGRLRHFVAVSASILLSTLSFVAPHAIVLGFYFGWFNWTTILASLAVALAGAYWAWLYQRSGSLLGPWLSHIFVDAALFLVGYDLARSLAS